jgi:FKBP-type peptidyl-prolyl cis-trans isomerase 2
LRAERSAAEKGRPCGETAQIMRSIRKGFVAGLVLALFAVGLVVSACRSKAPPRVIVPGDRVRVEYTCTLPNGDLVATTDERAAKEDSLRTSALYVAGETQGRPVLRAGSVGSASGAKEQQEMRSVLHARLSEALVGMRIGETRKVALSAEVPPGLKDSERFLQMARVRKRAKEKVMTREFFLRFSQGKGPELGQQVVLEPGFLGVVSSWDDKSVTLRVTPESGGEITTDFGPGRVQDKGDHYAIELDVSTGTLVRVGSLVGRVTEVGEDTFTLDFGHPFGGEIFQCRVHAAALEAPEAEAKDGNRNRAGDGTRVEEGDIAEIQYTVRTESGQEVPVAGTDGRSDSSSAGLSALEDRPNSKTEFVLAGQDASIPNLSQAVIGARRGEGGTLRIPLEEAYGPRDPEKVLRFPRIRKTPRILKISVEEFANAFGVLPQEGQSLHWVPYFDTRVVSATVREVTLENLAENGRRIDEPFGTTEVSVQGAEIVTRLDPLIGAPFEHEKRKGKIVSADEDFFTVDFNHPLAGEALYVEWVVSAVTKAEAVQGKKISWIEDYQAGMDAARIKGKPALLVLYASDCPWSRKLLNETLEDPRLKAMEDRFVWIRVDSAQNADLQAVYEQRSFPTLLLLSPMGTVLGKQEGFVTARGLLEELERWTTGQDARS